MVQNIFSLDGSQNYILLQPLTNYLTSKNGKIGSQQSERMSEESIKSPSTKDF